MKLALGTVQLGLPYGIANQNGQINSEEAGKIIALARKSGLDTLDTAIAYGDSETCLGKIGSQGFKVITKLPDMPNGIHDIATWVNEQLQASLHRLNVDSVYGLLLHRSEQLLGAKGRSMVQALERLKIDGIAQKIGISIYAPQELDVVLQYCAIDLVQAPLNLIDRRLVTSGWLQRLHEQGIEVHVRSVFLQGLMLLPRASIPTKFERWAYLWDAWHDGLARNNLSAASSCLQYPLSLPEVDRVVVGVDSVSQLRELITIAQSPAASQNWSMLGCEDENLVNPSKWNAL